MLQTPYLKPKKLTMTNFYPRKLLLLTVTLLLAIFAQASYLRNVPQKLIQPNGDVINCFATGDEFYHWLHDKDGFTIVQNPQTGYFCYAELSKEELIASQYVVGEVSPASVGLTPRINISAQKMGEIRERFLNLEKEYITSKKGTYSGPRKVNTTGELNNIVIYIRFSGEAEYTTSQTTYTEKFNSNTAGVLSQHNYFNEVSYGTLNMNTNFLPTNNGTQILSYQDSHTRNYFLKYNVSTNPQGYQDETARTDREHTLLKAAVDFVAGQLSSSINIDNDNDGYVDNVCFIVQGSSAGWSDLLWPHKWSLYTKVAMINSKQVDVYNFQLQNDLDVSVLCHEMFHTLGAPDLYHYTDGNPDPVGMWDLMNQNLSIPQHMTQYMKYRYGHWIDAIPEITASGDYSLNPVFTKDNSCYKIKSPFSTTEYFVIEYRKKEKTDIGLPNEGLLVYRINTAADGQGNKNGPPDELYVYRPYGSTTTTGDLEGAPFSLELGKTSCSDKTEPNAFLSNEGVGGLNISNISAIGSTISFHVDILTPLAYDVVAAKVLSPITSDELTSTEKIKVTVSNLGLTDITSGLKVNYSVNGGSIVTEDFVGTLAAKASAPFEFAAPVDLSTHGMTYNIKVYTTLASDLNTDNDTINATVINPIPIEYLATHASIIAGTYNEITTGTIIDVDAPKNGLSAPITFPDGFTFNYSGITFSKFILSTNGFIKLGDQNPSSNSLFFKVPKVVDGSVEGGLFNSLDEADNNIIAPFNYDLTPGAGGAEYRIDISGVAPSRVVTIQFKNVRDNDAVLPNQYSSMNFQIKLYESSNVIEFVYGTWTPSANTSDYRHALVGLRGLGNFPSQLLAVNKGSTIAWNQVTFANGNYSTSAALNFGNSEGGTTTRPAPPVGFTIHLAPRALNDIAVKEIYTLGQLPLNNALPHTISAYVYNEGTTVQTNVNVTLSITGSNTFNPAVITIPTIEPGKGVVVNFAEFTPTVAGTNTVTVSVPNDDFNPNNSKAISQNTTSGTFNYSSLSTTAESAFPGAFVAVCKYHINGSAKIVSVDAMILDNPVMTGLTTKAYVFNSAGTIIGQSSNYTVADGNLGKWVTFNISAQPLVTDNDFYLGLDCTNGYFAAYQTENPTRDGAYFKIPVAGGTPVAFGNNARLMFRANTRLPQTITFDALPTKVVGDPDFAPGATSSSLLTVTYASSKPIVATIVSGMIHIVGTGSCVITASQAGNSTYAPAANVTQTLTVSPATGIETNDDTSIKIYSNSQEIFVEIPVLKGSAELSIYNILGNQVYKSNKLTQGTNRITQDFNNGTYIVKVLIDKNVKTEKVVINK